MAQIYAKLLLCQKVSSSQRSALFVTRSGHEKFSGSLVLVVIVEHLKSLSPQPDFLVIMAAVTAAVCILNTSITV